MSRNTEKAQSSLNRFQALKNKEAGILESNPNLRPKYVQSVDSLPQAEKWRSTIIGEISVKLTKIQDPALNEYQIRDVNDSLNKLFNEKKSWEYHIKNLGGADYIHFNKDFNNAGKLSQLDSQGSHIKGYRYFGRAKELPDVKEVLMMQAKKSQANKSKRTKELEQNRLLNEQEKRITADYYGVYDEIHDGNDDIIDSNERDIINQVNEVLGDEIIVPLDDINENYIAKRAQGVDNLIEFEKNRGKRMFRKLKNNQQNGNKDSSVITNFEKEVPTTDEVTKWIVNKKRAELIARLGINKP
ncbi:Pre-mRNA-splicing factor ISY1 [Debaryomyces fabryi]|uniref:Pre-mRNA-splicing factor ISY1 n=1 Tax=Debaryomyces fabryi TaxID=58627 RepID=A0A0V1PXY4_9ASCO|nr:Pre-mRNA-splicing factor ISY1 [Debaryomyces fabryi]KSA01124.1 Pre-mRNA-splicing factor ISY1 [Debaryomyces fabryi]CUM55473.1 unnamed protein product [Debaryomyces fabryi]